ncbi:MAG: hypothetical protein GY715_14360 [Planctomycetes bacterium]|nr:hypothetical protein [Planctomycetota bacterium]
MLDAGLNALFTLGGAIPLAAFWIAAAIGFGWPLRAWLVPGTRAPLCVQAVLGVAALLVVDTIAARTGALYLAGGALGWSLLAAGTLMLLEQARRHGGGGALERLPRLSRVAWAAAPPLLVLLVAAASAPGWLWGSEFGGYDALSYHLQLPREWWDLGRAAGLEHNVYSYLPSYVECAYAHLFAVRHGAIEAAYACQVLHGGLAVLASIVTGRAATMLAGRAIGAAAAVLVLATPWVVVVGSLAYNEMAVTLMLAGALLLLLDDAEARPARLGVAIGVMLGVAAGAKPTALLLVVVPVLGLLVFSAAPRGRTRLVSVSGAVLGVGLAIAPALAHDLVATGNPVFPFLTGWLGSGHWSAEQAAIWDAGHGADLRLGERLRSAWDQLARYGIGPAPDPGEPWRPQWSVLPWLAVVACAIGVTDRRHRATALRLATVLGIQVVLWIAFTHVKSRFMVPAVAPAALVIAVAAASLRPRVPRAAAAVGLLALVAASLVPAILLAGEKDGRPFAALGATGVFAGEAHAQRLRAPDLTAAERGQLLADAVPALWVNFLLPPDARVLSVGDATPLYYRGPGLVYQTTWDRGPFSAALRDGGDDDAAVLDALRRDGFTHVLVDPAMLTIWQREGWNDPPLTAERVLGACEAHATEIARMRSGARLFKL